MSSSQSSLLHSDSSVGWGYWCLASLYRGCELLRHIFSLPLMIAFHVGINFLLIRVLVEEAGAGKEPQIWGFAGSSSCLLLLCVGFSVACVIISVRAHRHGLQSRPFVETVEKELSADPQLGDRRDAHRALMMFGFVLAVLSPVALFFALHYVLLAFFPAFASETWVHEHPQNRTPAAVIASWFFGQIAICFVDAIIMMIMLAWPRSTTNRGIIYDWLCEEPQHSGICCLCSCCD